MDTSRRVCDIQFSLIVGIALVSPLGNPEVARQLYVSRRNRRRRRIENDHVVVSSVESLQQWANAQECSFTTIRGYFEARHHLRDLAVNMIDEVSSHNIPVVWALQCKEGPTADSASHLYTTKDVLKHIFSQLLQQNHTLLNEKSVGLNIARFQIATSEDQWFSLLGSVLEGLNTVYVVIDVEVLASAVLPEQVWPEAFVVLFDQLRLRNVSTKVKVAFLSSGGTQNESLLGSKGMYCVDVPKVKSGRIEKKLHNTKVRRRSGRQARLITNN